MGDWAKCHLLQDGDMLEPSYDKITDNVDVEEERGSLAISPLAER